MSKQNFFILLLMVAVFVPPIMWALKDVPKAFRAFRENLYLEKARLVLDLLGSGEMSGLELVEASGGRLKRGTVYVTLARMKDDGLIESRDGKREFTGIPQKIYKVI